MSKRCMVHGCENRSDQGCFVGDMCAPCYAMITSGDTSIRSTNFISKLKTITESLLNKGTYTDIELEELWKETKYRRLIAAQKWICGIMSHLMKLKSVNRNGKQGEKIDDISRKY